MYPLKQCGMMIIKHRILKTIQEIASPEYLELLSHYFTNVDNKLMV